MIVGPSGHGKTTLLSNVKSKSKAIPQPVTFLDRQLSYSVNASAVLSKSFNSLSKSGIYALCVGMSICVYVCELAYVPIIWLNCLLQTCSRQLVLTLTTFSMMTAVLCYRKLSSLHGISLDRYLHM